MTHYFTHEILTELQYRAAGRQMAIQALLTFSENELSKLYDSEAKEKEVYNSILYFVESIAVRNKGILNLDDVISDIKAIFFE